MKTFLNIFPLPLFLSGCATLIDEYEQRLEVRNMNDSMTITVADGSAVPLLGRHNKVLAGLNRGPKEVSFCPFPYLVPHEGRSRP